jgi:DNA-binding NarL/FixJ family response regulator
MKVQVAATAGEALAVLDDGPPLDILLTDVGLPDMNGVELAARFREAWPDVAVLYMSGHSDEVVLRKMARERSSGFVEKPFTVATLMEAISSTGGRDESASMERKGA